MAIPPLNNKAKAANIAAVFSLLRAINNSKYPYEQVLINIVNAIKFNAVIVPEYLGMKCNKIGKHGKARYTRKCADVIYMLRNKDMVFSTSVMLSDDSLLITLGKIMKEKASSISIIAWARENEKVNIPNSSTE